MIIKNTKEETRVIKHITYTCSDGTTFKNEDDAECYEKYLATKEIVKNLKCRTENFKGFEKYFDVAYYCSSKEEFDAVCVVIKYESIYLRYEDDDFYIEYQSEAYEDEGWYYFKVDKDYVDDYNYNWRLYICGLNIQRNTIQKEFNEVKKKLDTFNEMYSQYF